MSFKIRDMIEDGKKIRNNTGQLKQRLGSWHNYIAIKVLIFDKFKSMLNIKNQKSYTLLSSEIINATNKDDGMIMVLYTDGENLYVRELSEFGIKFEESE